MKKKRQRGSSVAILARLQRRLTASFAPRRRFHLPAVFALAFCAFLCFVAFSLLLTSPVDDEDYISLPRSRPSRKDGEELPSNSDRGSLFSVPQSGGSLERDLWSTSQSKFFYGCSNASKGFANADVKTHPNRYLLIATSGGLNQQRTGITDAVVAAYILNATLVVPKLDENSFWRDTSGFADIFDVDWFISSLSKDVRIIKQLPNEGGQAINPHHMRVPRKCTPRCYETRVLPVLNKKHAVQLGKFDYRLSNKLDKDLQKLRCRVNYHALRFTNPIAEMGKNLVQRMRMRSKHFITLHLRFEPDMLAFSGCYYGGGEKEREELGAIRKRWKSLPVSNPEKVRRHGRCPLTPEEMGLMLRALGFGSDVHIYVASGDVYGGEETLAPLKALFPNFHTKETLGSEKELEPFSSFSSRMAALDFIVCAESDVFVTNNNGNMARILAGRRRYFGHKPTIRPNAKKLYRLFLDRNNMTWEEFASKVRTHQIGFMGEPNEIKPGRGEFHENPSTCICEANKPKPEEVSVSHHRTPDGDNDDKEDNTNRSTGEAIDEQLTDDYQDLAEMDYADDGNTFQKKRMPNRTDSGSIVLSKPDQPEVDEIFSD